MKSPLRPWPRREALHEFDTADGPRATTLRITVPPGTHRAHLLRGDAGFAFAPTVVSQDGAAVSAPTDTLPAGRFAWQSWPVDGGASGRTVDLTLTGDNDFWRLNGLVLL